ncbi:MAG: protein MpaA [Candidatus Azotimanducaceae bacterium]|jgi:protein MpaA
MKVMVRVLLRSLVLAGVLSTLVSCASQEQEPSAGKEPSANKEPSADRDLSANKEPSAGKEPSANKEPSADKEPAANKDVIADKSPSSESENPTVALPTDNSASRDAELESVRLASARVADAAAIEKFCLAIGNKLGSVSVADCQRQPLVHSGLSNDGYSIAYREYLPVSGKRAIGKVLVLGGIHGDEFSSVSVVFKWLNILDQFHSGLIHWRIVPSVNPDGLLRRRSQRQNSNGVDLNRNFPTADWSESAVKYWAEETGSHPRRNPGHYPASEVETRWVVDQIDSFDPDVIISMHAPYHLVDYDGPPTAPESLGGLYLKKLGVYPGSLGNYAGIDRNKPIVTVELKSAGIMPPQIEIDTMWNDLVRWLVNQLAANDLELNSDPPDLIAD